MDLPLHPLQRGTKKKLYFPGEQELGYPPLDGAGGGILLLKFHKRVVR
jgi:hypothetical protein